MGKEDNNTAMWVFGSISVVCLTGIAISAMVIFGPVSVTVAVGVTVGVGGATANIYIV